MNAVLNDARRVFLKKGTCSQTLFFLLDREFANPKENEERAADPLAGGIMQRGHQCGMLWGASLAVGAESFPRLPDLHRKTESPIGIGPYNVATGSFSTPLRHPIADGHIPVHGRYPLQIRDSWEISNSGSKRPQSITLSRGASDRDCPPASG